MNKQSPFKKMQIRGTTSQKEYDEDVDNSGVPNAGYKLDSTPLNIKEAAYEKQNRKMRKDYTSETGKKLGSRQTSGTGKRRVSFACRFAGMAGAMKDAKGEPTKKAMALKKWGFGSVGAASSFCSKHKSKK